MRFASAAFLFACALRCSAQAPAANVLPATPACNIYLVEQSPTLNLKQRFCMWVDRSVFSGEGLAGAVTGGVYSQFTERSMDRGKGVAGLATRIGTKYAQSTAKGAGETLGGWIGREDMRREAGPWRPLHGEGFGKRLGHALAAPFWNYSEGPASGGRTKRFAVSRVAGALASGFMGMAWAPDRLNTPGRALRRSASAYGGYFSSSLVKEFGPELRKLISWL